MRRAVILLLAACATAGCAPRKESRVTSRESGENAAPVATDSVLNPLASNREAALQGERLFTSMNCDGCHGPGALGFVGPNLVDGRWRFGGSDAAVYESILNGRAQGMPAYGGMLSESTIWQLVTYLKSQPVPEDIATEAWP